MLICLKQTIFLLKKNSQVLKETLISSPTLLWKTSFLRTSRVDSITNNLKVVQVLHRSLFSRRNHYRPRQTLPNVFEIALGYGV